MIGDIDKKKNKHEEKTIKHEAKSVFVIIKNSSHLSKFLGRRCLHVSATAARKVVMPDPIDHATGINEGRSEATNMHDGFD